MKFCKTHMQNIWSCKVLLVKRWKTEPTWLWI